jgi:hypothetical protein
MNDALTPAPSFLRRPPRFAIAFALAATVAAAEGGCGVSYGACAVQCGDAGCPDGLACAQDGFCHASGDATDCRGAPGAGGAGVGGPGSSSLSSPTACAAAKVECGPARGPDGRALDCGGCAGPSRCDAGKCLCTASGWAKTDVGPLSLPPAALAVDQAGDTLLAFRDAAGSTVRFGRRPPAGSFTFETLGPACPDSTPALASAPDGATLLAYCAPGPDTKPVFRLLARPPGGALAELPAPSGPAGADPVLLASADGTWHLFYTVEGQGVTYARRPPGGAWAAPVTVTAGRLKAAAVGAAGLAVAYGEGDSSEAPLALAARGLAPDDPWRTFTKLPQLASDFGRDREFLDSLSSSVALAPDGTIVVAHAVFNRLVDKPDTNFDPGFARTLFGFAFGADGSKKSDETLRAVSESYTSAMAVDEFGRPHLLHVSRYEYNAPKGRYEATTAKAFHQVYAGGWSDPEPALDLTDLPEEPKDAPPVALAVSKAGLHAVYGGVLAELCQ